MTRRAYIEQLLEQVYGEPPSADASLTYNMVNVHLNVAIGVAAKSSFGENMKIENVQYVNNAFYTTFRNISVSVGSDFSIYESSLPQIPIGLGKNEGTTVYLKDNAGISQPLMELDLNQINFYDNLPQPLALPYWKENKTVFFKSPNVILTNHTMTVRMISSVNTDLDSDINVPDDFYPIMNDYILKQLMIELNQPKDETSDGRDNSAKN